MYKDDAMMMPTAMLEKLADDGVFRLIRPASDKATLFTFRILPSPEKFIEEANLLLPNPLSIAAIMTHIMLATKIAGTSCDM